MTWRSWLGILVLNAAIALSLRAIAPSQPVNSDRAAYEYVGRNAFEPNCPVSIYCYRFLVPMLLEGIPLPPEERWRGYEFLASTLAGFVIAFAIAQLTSDRLGPLLATILAQTGFAFAYTAYDPFTADPLVFLIYALIVLAWFRDWPALAFGLAVVGVLAKETVALVATSVAIAAVIDRHQTRWRPWIGVALGAWIVVLGTHWAMNTYAPGRGVTADPAADLARGSWLVLWLKGQSALWVAMRLFGVFGLVWFYAALGLRLAPGRLRSLALGACLPMLMLNYVQNPERALGSVYFVMVPLAAVFLGRLPAVPALLAVITSGLLTTKLALSTVWLPRSRFLAIPAAAVGAWVMWGGLPRRAIERSEPRKPEALNALHQDTASND